MTSGTPPTGGSALLHVRSVTVNYAAAMLDNTEMGFLTKTNIPGLFEWSIDVEVLQDYAVATSNDAILFPLVGNTGAATFMLVKPDSGAVSTSNPQFYGNAALESYGPITGSVGTLQVVKATFRAAGTLTRATS
jgi:hypothetical protein